MEPTKILVVEDDLFLRELYADTLKNEGYLVESAEDGNSAFTKMHAGGWDLVLLDIILPDIDGFQVMQKLQENPPLKPNKKVVFLTNLDSDEKIKEALKLGNGYMIKSQLTPGEMMAEIKHYLAV